MKPKHKNPFHPLSWKRVSALLDAVSRANLRRRREFPERYSLPITERHTSEVINSLNLGKHKLEGKKVLDIGSGFSLLETQMAEKADVTSLDLAFAFPEMREFANAVGIKKAVAGDWKNMPVRSESFDITISSWGISHINNPEKLKPILLEVMRTVKKGRNSVSVYLTILNTHQKSVKHWFLFSKSMALAQGLRNHSLRKLNITPFSL